MRKILLLLLVAPRLDAATQYRVTIQTTGNPQQKAPIAATVLVDGAQRRVSVGNNLTMLSTDGGSTVISLDHRQRTWWNNDHKSIVGRPRAIGGQPALRNVKVRALRVVTSDEPSDERFADVATHKYVVRATYTLSGQIDGSPADSDDAVTIFLWTTDSLDPATAVAPIDLTTGTAEVDAELGLRVAAVPGFAMRTVVIATHAFAGGAPQVETMTATVDDVRSVTPAPGTFDRPRDYANQLPPVGR